MASDNESCEQRIPSQLASREEQLEEIFEKIDSDDISTNDNGWAELNELAIGFDQYRIIKCTFSTGGPADWIEIKLGSYSEGIISVTYHFSDWFDHAQTKVHRHSPIYRYAEDMLETLDGY
jgi:hypothetical protein